MSDNTSDPSESCPVKWCDFSSDSSSSVRRHFGRHDEEEKKEVLLDELRRVGDHVGRVPSTKDMDEHGYFAAVTYWRLFDGWTQALSAVGWEPNREPDIPSEDLLDELRRLSEELGRPPAREEMAQQGRFSGGVYSNRFGCWADEVEEAGLIPLRRRDIPKEDLIKELCRLANDLGRVPKYDDMGDHGRFSTRPYEDNFGSWNGALKEAGFELNQHNDASSGDLLSELHRLSDVVDETPQIRDLVEHGRYSIDLYQDAFGSWNEALEEAGYSPNKRRNIPTEDLLEELRRLHRELDRVPISRNMRNEGIHSPDVYQDRFDSWNAALEAAGFDGRTQEDWALTGEDHHSWNGGHVKYYGPNWGRQRRRAVERDGRQCTECSIEESDYIDQCGMGLHVHHKRPLTTFPFVDGEENRAWGEVNALSNLVTCCRGCHADLEEISREEYPADEYPRHIQSSEKEVERTQSDLGEFA